MAVLLDRNTQVVVTLEPVSDGYLARLTEEAAGKYTPDEFLRWYRREARSRGCDRVQLGGMDRRIAADLVKQYGDRLKDLTILFLRRHADPLIRGEYSQHMRLLKAMLPEIVRDQD